MEESSKKISNLTEGTLWYKILIFALPLAASSIMQQLFNSADVAVVGRFAGKEALAAVGSNAPIINLIVNLFVGLSIGANVVISRFIGENNVQKVQRAVHTSILLALVSGVFLAVFGMLVSGQILKIMGSPHDVIDLASLYLKIYFLGMPFQMLYNFGAAILRSKGDTRRPLICLFVSGIINVLLNLLFVVGLNMSVAGVAIATVISQIISSCLLMVFLVKEDSFLRVDFKKLCIDRAILKKIAVIGLPAGLQGMVFSFSNVCIQTQINHLGSPVVAGSSAALNFECLAFFLLSSFGQASVTFVSQNYGASKLNRCSRTTWLCMGMGIMFTLALCSAFVIFANPLVRLYTTDETVAGLAVMRMKFILLFQIINQMLEVFSGSIRGYGYSLVPAVIAVIGVCGLRILWVNTIYQTNPVFEMLLMIYPISWTVTTLGLAVAYFIIRHKIKAELQQAV